MRKTKLIFTKENLIEKVKEIEKKHKGLACQIEIKIMNGPEPEISRYGDLGNRRIKVVPIYKSGNPLMKADLKEVGGEHESITQLDFLLHGINRIYSYCVKEDGIFLDEKFGGHKVANIIYERLK